MRMGRFISGRVCGSAGESVVPTPVIWLLLDTQGKNTCNAYKISIKSNLPCVCSNSGNTTVVLRSMKQAAAGTAHVVAFIGGCLVFIVVVVLGNHDIGRGRPSIIFFIKTLVLFQLITDTLTLLGN